MSMYRIRPNKTSRVWPPEKDDQNSKDSPAPQTVQLRQRTQIKDKPAVQKQTDQRSEQQPETQPKQTLNNLKPQESQTKRQEPQSNLKEQPTKPLLKPVKPREKDTSTSEPLSKPVLKPLNSKDAIKLAPLLKPAVKPLKSNEKEPSTPEPLLKPVLKPLKSQEKEKDRIEPILKPAIKPLKSNEKEPTTPEPLLKPVLRPVKSQEKQPSKPEPILRPALRPVKSQEKEPSKSESILKPVLKPIKSRENELNATEPVLKSALKPLKPRESPPSQLQPESKPILRPVKAREQPPPVQEQPSKPALRPVKQNSPTIMATECEWKRDAFRKQNRWSQNKSTDLETPQPITSAPSEPQQNLTKEGNVPWRRRRRDNPPAHQIENDTVTHPGVRRRIRNNNLQPPDPEVLTEEADTEMFEAAADTDTDTMTIPDSDPEKHGTQLNIPDDSMDEDNTDALPATHQTEFSDTDKEETIVESDNEEFVNFGEEIGNANEEIEEFDQEPSPSTPQNDQEIGDDLEGDQLCETEEVCPQNISSEANDLEEEDQLVKATRMWLEMGKKGEIKTAKTALPPLDPDEEICIIIPAVISPFKGFPSMLGKNTRQLENDMNDNSYFLSGKQSSDSGAPPPPPPPPPSSNAPGAPPPPPPPPGSKVRGKGKSQDGRNTLVDSIKKASRTRPDWKTLLKDLQGGIKLKHVKSEDKLDRSCPILPNSRGKGGKFLYESETPDVKQSMLLNEIQRGVKLRRVKTNDRSRPDFQRLGLKKLRKQMTCEEKKAIPADAPEALPSSSDEEEDIDFMRDDLKATKLQLAEELKKTKQMEREAKIHNIDIESLKAEVKKLKRHLKEAGVHDVKPIRNCEAADMVPKLSKSMSKLRLREEDLDFSDLDVIDEEINTLKDQIDAQRKRAEKAEQKYDDVNQKMKLTHNTSDEWELRSVYFEKKYKSLQKDQGIELPDINCIGTQTDPIEISSPICLAADGQHLLSKKSASRKSFGVITHMESFQEEDEEDSEEETSSEETETESEEETECEEESSSEVEGEAVKRGEVNESKRKERDLNMWQNKISQAKERVRIAHKERSTLRDKIRKYYKDMRTERKEYLRVKEDLKAMAEALKDPADEEEESESTEEESESEEDESQKKPKKLKRRKDKDDDFNGEIDSPEEDLENLDGLKDPEWEESEDEESDDDDEDDQLNSRIRKLQARTQHQESELVSCKKESHSLKTQLTRCDEMYNEEKRRHQRLDNELQMLLAALE